MTVSMNEYRCAMCGGEFISPRSDSEAIAEMNHYFGEVPESEQVEVCDDCFQKIHPADFPEKVAAAVRELKADIQ